VLRSSHHQPAAAPAAGGFGADLQVSTADRLALLQIVIGGADSAANWLEARIVLLASQAISTEEIVEITGVAAADVETAIDRFRREGRCA
jgi:hypothetical protein